MYHYINNLLIENFELYFLKKQMNYNDIFNLELNKILSNLVYFKTFKLPNEQYSIIEEKLVVFKCEIFSEEEKEVSLSFYASNKKTKMFINNQFSFILNAWINKKVIQLQKGINEIVFIVENICCQNKAYIVINDLEYTVNEKYNIKDQANVTKYYIDANINNNILNVTVNTNYLKLNNEKGKIILFGEKVDNKLQWNKKIISESKIVVGENTSIIIPQYWFEEYDSLLLGYFTDKNSFNRNTKIFAFYRLFLKKEEDVEFKIIDIFKTYIGDFVEKWYYNSLIRFYQKIVNRNCSISLKLELFRIFINYYNHVRKYNDEITFMNSPGLKYINIISKLDDKPYDFIINISRKNNIFKKRDIIFVLSRDNSNANIEKISGKVNKDIIVVEFSTRGLTFGNSICEATFFEVLEYVKKFYNIKNIYMVGYSSAASSIYSLITKYPELIKGGLMVAGITDNLQLCKTINNKMIYIYGSDDEQFDFYRKREKLLKDYKNSFSIEIKNCDHININLFMNHPVLLKLLMKNPLVIKNIKKDNFIKNNTQIKDVYLKPLEINVNSLNETYIVEKFSSPLTMGYGNNINIKYPIVFCEYPNFKLEKNLILYNYDSEIFTDNLLIRCCKNHFTYCGVDYYGNYSIIQLYQNKLLLSEYLLVNDNDIKMSEKNFFLRNIILPSGITSRKSMMNMVAIIYYNNKYYYVESEQKKLIEMRKIKDV